MHVPLNSRIVPARRSGFSLVELLVVVGCMALLLGVVIPGFASGNRARKFSNELQSMELALTMARTHAVSRSTYTWATVEERDGKLQVLVEESLAGTSVRQTSTTSQLGTPLKLEMEPAAAVSQAEIPRDPADETLSLPVSLVFSPEGTVRSEAAATLPRKLEFAVAQVGTAQKDPAVVQVSGISGQVSIKRR